MKTLTIVIEDIEYDAWAEALKIGRGSISTPEEWLTRSVNTLVENAMEKAIEESPSTLNPRKMNPAEKRTELAKYGVSKAKKVN